MCYAEETSPRDGKTLAATDVFDILASLSKPHRERRRYLLIHLEAYFTHVIVVI
jgi:hypothetical protein